MTWHDDMIIWRDKMTWHDDVTRWRDMETWQDDVTWRRDMETWHDDETGWRDRMTRQDDVTCWRDKMRLVTWHDEIGDVTCLPPHPRCTFEQGPTGQCRVIGHIKNIKHNQHCQWWTAPFISIKIIAHFLSFKKQLINCRTDARTDTPSFRGAKTHLINVNWIYWRSLSLRSSVSPFSSGSTLIRDKSNLRKWLTPNTQRVFFRAEGGLFSSSLHHHPTTLKHFAQLLVDSTT